MDGQRGKSKLNNFQGDTRMQEEGAKLHLLRAAWACALLELCSQMRYIHTYVCICSCMA